MITHSTIPARTDPAAGIVQSAADCCSGAEQAVCCEPADKAACCGGPAAAASSGCGCR